MRAAREGVAPVPAPSPFGGGEMARRVRAHDWAATPLGPAAGWPQSLRTAVDVVLASGHAMQLAWGPERTVLYNDAYAPMLGDRHPGALGLPFREAWPDIWGEIEPLVARVFAGGTVRFEDMPLVMTRRGYPEDTWWNFSYSPVRDESGAVAGLLNVTVDATGRVRADRAERERDKAHARLRENEGRLRALVNASSNVVYTMSPGLTEMRRLDGRGLVAGAPVIRWLDEHVFQEDRASVVEAVNKAVASKGVFELEHRALRADGSAGWTFSRAVPVLGEDGGIAEWFGMAADVTAQRESDERQAFLLRLADALRPLDDADAAMEAAARLLGEHLGVNRAFYGEVEGDDWVIAGGYEKGIVPLTPGRYAAGTYGDWMMETYRRGGVLDFSDSRSDPRFRAPERAALARFRITAALGVGLVKNGTLSAILAVHSATPRAWTPGETALLGEVAERTWAAVERARAEAALRGSEARLRNVLGSMAEGFALLGPDFTILDVNDETLRLDGRPREELVGRSHWDAFPGSEHSAIGGLLTRAMRGRASGTLEHRYAWPDGRAYWLDARAYPTPDGGVAVFWRDVTDRKRTEDALRESEAKYRNLFESIDEGFCIIEVVFDASGRPVDYVFLETNPAFQKQTGWADAVGKRMREIAPAHEEFWFEVYGRIVRTGQPERFEHRVAAIGSWFSVFAFRVGEPEQHRVAVLFDDIEQRKRAEAVLRESEERFRTLAEAIEDVFYMTDLDRDVLLYVSPAYERVWGRPAAELLADVSRFRQTLHPDDLPAQQEAHAARLRGGPAAVEYRIHRPDGEVRWILDRSFPVRGGEGRVIAGIATDVTERKAARERLSESEARLRTLVEGVPQPVWRSDGEGRWGWASPRWADYTGREDGSGHGHGWLDAVHPADRAAVLEAWRGARGGGGAFRADHRLWHAAEGRWRWAQSQALPVRGGPGGGHPDGGGAEWIGTTTDVEELRRAHEQRILIEELHHRGRNLLAVVSGIAEQTLAASTSPEEFGVRFEQRLAALGRVQGLLSREVAPCVTVGELVRLELAAHGSDAEGADAEGADAEGADAAGRVRLDGPEVVLPGRAVQLVALALHELLTNALKHGALRAPGGRLEVAWAERRGGDGGGRRLRLDWREDGVALPGGAPAPRRGFGLDLIEHSLPYELDAETSLEFAHDGLRCSIELPLEDAPAAMGTVAGA